MTFDQYSRYRACADIIDRISNSGDIMDIGSGYECLLGSFIEGRDITYVDPLLARLETRGSNQIATDIFNGDLGSRKYDYVCSVDTLEHIPEPKRKNFIDIVSDIAQKGIVIGFPSSDDDVADKVDEIISHTFQKEYGRKYSWLEEHFRYGLPKKANVVAQLQQLGWNVSLVGHGHAPWLGLLLSVVVSGWEIHETHSEILRFSKRFMDELYSYDFNPPFYRWFIVASKKKQHSSPLKFGVELDQLATNRFNNILMDAFSSIFSIILGSGESFGVKYVEANNRLSEISTWAQGLQERLYRNQKLIKDYEDKTVEMERSIEQLQCRLEMYDRHALEPDSNTIELARWAQGLQYRLNEANSKLMETASHAQSLQVQLSEIVNSRAWKFAVALRRMFRIILPQNSVIERYAQTLYNHIRKFISRINGFILFLNKTKKYYKNNGAVETVKASIQKIRSVKPQKHTYEVLRKQYPEKFKNLSGIVQSNQSRHATLEISAQKVLKNTLGMLGISIDAKKILDAINDFFGKEKFYMAVQDLFAFERAARRIADNAVCPLVKASELPVTDQTTKRKKILFITALFPNTHHGGGNRVLNFVKELSRNNDIYLFTPFAASEDEDAYKQITPYCRSIKRISYWQYGGNQTEITKWLEGLYMDVVHYEWPRSLENFSRSFGRYHIFTYMESVSLRLLMDLQFITPMSTAWVEKFTMLLNSLNLELAQTINLDARIAVTTKDGNFFKKIFPHQEYTVLNHGLSFGEFTLPDIESEANCLVFVGNYAHYPNVDAMSYFFNDIWKYICDAVPDVRIYVVGTNPPESLKQLNDDVRIIVTGKVSDVRPYIQKASVCIAPLITGAGLRGKVIEYAALRRTFVATSIATSDLVFRNGTDYFCADTAEEFRRFIIELLKDNEKRKQMAENAYAIARENYDTQHIVEFLDRIYNRMRRTALANN